jgi:hypothetical protein
MGLVTKPHTFTASTTALSSEVNANFDAIYNVVNGNIEAANIASGAVGEAELAASAVTNAKVSASAAIALSKLAALTATIVPITDASGVLSSSAVTPTELGHLTGVTSAIQTQIDAVVNNGSVVYKGYVSSTGTGTGLPSGWTVSRTSTGLYEITHNLGLAAFTDMQVVASVNDSVSRFAVVDTGTAIFRVRTFDAAGASSDEDFHFIAVR